MEQRVIDVNQLLPIFGEGRPSPVLLLGAGASLRSGVPLAGSLVEWAARWRFCRDQQKNVNDPTVRRTDWLEFLHSQSWYDQDKRPEDNYFQAMQSLLVPKSERKEFLLWVVNRDVPASSGYEHLLSLLDKGVVSTVLTTNFDRVLPDLKAARKRPHHLEVIRTPDETVAFSTWPLHAQLVYLHGAVEYYTDQTLESEVQKLRSDLIPLLTPLLRDHPLVVIGYRGAEPSIMKSLLTDQADITNKYPHGIYWCTLTPTVHPLVCSLADAIHPNLQFVLTVGFDELMQEVVAYVDAQPSRRSPGRAMEATSTTLPFDMTAVHGATLEDLDWLLVGQQLRRYCSRLNVTLAENATRDQLCERMIELDLLTKVDGAIVPTVAGYLLFAHDPSTRLPSAMIDVSVDGKKARTVSGNLWKQRDALESLLDELNQPFILKTRDSEVVYPYPKIALRELCTNALVHRSYERHRATSIEVEPNCIRLVNQGGLVEEVAERVHSSLQEQIESGITGLKGYRNTVLADILCGTGAMEKKGSGLPDVHRSVLKGGGKVFFGPTEDNGAFKAIIYRRPEVVDLSTQTATPASNVTRYYANLLEVQRLPDVVWITDISDMHSSIAGNCPTFPVSEREVVSFAHFGSSARPVSLEEQISFVLGSRQLTGLVNECLYRFFETRGLIVDRSRKRAYFPRTRDGAREVKYQATVRQATRTVTKPFVSKTTQRVLYWIHEAIWFGFERFGSQYALRILPGYVFTTDGNDQLLFHKKVGPLATRKAARDFSLQVFNHLTFWSWVLAGGSDQLAIPTGAEPIVIKASYASCEVEISAVADVSFQPEEYQLRSDAELELIQQEVEEDVEVAKEAEDHASRD